MREAERDGGMLPLYTEGRIGAKKNPGAFPGFSLCTVLYQSMKVDLYLLRTDWFYTFCFRDEPLESSDSPVTYSINFFALLEPIWKV